MDYSPLNFYTGKGPGDEGYSQFLDGGGGWVYDLAKSLGFTGPRTIQTGHGDNSQAEENPEILRWLQEQGYEVRAGFDRATGSDTTQYRLFKDGQPTEHVVNAKQSDNDWFNSALLMAGGVTGANLYGQAANLAAGGLTDASLAGADAVAGGTELGGAGLDVVGEGAAAAGGGTGATSATGATTLGGTTAPGYSAAANYGAGMSGAQTGAFDAVLGTTGSTTLANAAGSLPTGLLEAGGTVTDALSGNGISTAARIAATGLGLAGVTQMAGDGGDIGAPDSRLVDTQANSLATQDDAISRLLANSDRLLPMQMQQLQRGLDATQTGYDQLQADRGWFLGRRNALTQQQDRMVSDANSFSVEDRGNQLAGQAAADVNRSFATARDSAARTLARSGVNPNSMRYVGQLRQLGRDQALAQAAAQTGARDRARVEGYALTDRAAGALAGYPAAATGTAGAGATLAASGLNLANSALTGINSGVKDAATVAGQQGANAANMYGVQSNAYTNDDHTGDWTRLIGAGLGAAASYWGR